MQELIQKPWQGGQSLHLPGAPFRKPIPIITNDQNDMEELDKVKRYLEGYFTQLFGSSLEDEDVPLRAT
eukprot:11905220-Alexandrium_andersonii.AAC.1